MATINAIGTPQIILGGTFTMSGAFGFTGTLTGTTAVTFPTSGTLATTSQVLNPISQSSTPVTAAVGNVYVITDASTVTVTLPVTAAFGSIIGVVGDGAGGWIVQPGTGQTIKLVNASAGTSITSAQQYDTIYMMCVVANTTWVAYSYTTQGFTFV